MSKYKELQRLTSINKDCVLEEDIDGDAREVQINVGGTVFNVKRTLLARIPDSLLAKLDTSSMNFSEEKKEFYFERDPKLFKHILNAYREGELHVPRNVCPLRFRKEMEFWGISVQLVGACCWKDFYSVDEDLTTLNVLVKSTLKSQMQRVCGKVSNNNNNNNAVDGKDYAVKEDLKRKEKGENRKDGLQHRVWLFLDDPTSSTAAKIWCYFYIFLVLVSSFIVMIWNEPDVRVDPYINDYFYQGLLRMQHLAAIRNMTLPIIYNPKIIRFMSTDPHPALYTIDTICLFTFVIECMLHFAVCPHKITLLKDPYHWFKSGLSISIVASTILEIRRDVLSSTNRVLIYFILKGINVLRLLLIFRLRKFYKGFELMLLSLANSSKESALLLVAFSICVVIYGGLIYSAEVSTNMFDNTLYSMWWALITMTTVGYGDMYPTSYLGYLVGTLCAINGVIVIALPVAAIAQNFSNIYNRNSDLEKYLEDIKKEKEKNSKELASETKKL